VQLFVNELIGAVVQILIFTAIPFIVWLITARKRERFFRYIGLRKPETAEKAKVIIAIAAALGVSFLELTLLGSLQAKGIEMANSDFAGLGFPALPAALVYAFLRTALWEEIFFRGFLGARLIGRLGFIAGNTIQAFVFGLVHGVTMFGVLGVWIPLAVISMAGVLGFIMGYLREKSSGSIIPGILVHGLLNVISSAMFMFSVI